MTLSRTPDYRQFLHVLRRDARPDRLPFYEHIASPGFISRRLGYDIAALPFGSRDYWRGVVDFWMEMCFDVVPMEIPPAFYLESHESRGGAASHGSEAHVTIRSLAEAEAYPWPDAAAPIDFGHFETVAGLLPEGAAIVGGVCAGPYEWASTLLGVEGLAMAVCVDPELVAFVFARLGELYVGAVKQLAQMEAVCALRQGDDLGFKTSTFLSPAHLREYVFPIYAAMADAAHAAGKPFILHSCGNLGEVYDDIFACGIDAKHSFEDVILPVADFKRMYGARVTPLGGLDVDTICRADEAALRAYARRQIEACFVDGFWALGTGNSLTDYMPVENYLIVLDEGMRIAG